MKRISNNIISFIANSNLFICVCAFFFTRQGMLSLSLTDRSKIVFYPLLVSLSVFAVYGAQRLYHAKKAPPPYSEREQWYMKNFSLMLVLAALASIGAGLLLFKFSFVLVLYFLPLLIISLLYYLGPFPLRKVYMLKGFLIALVWSAASVLIPHSLFINTLPAEKMIFMLIGKFLLLAGLCIPFDIRDIRVDKEKKIKSFPVVFGIQNSKIISVLMILLFPFLVYLGNGEKFIVTAAAITAVVSIITVLFASEKRNEFYYSFIVDGMLLLHFINWKVMEHLIG